MATEVDLMHWLTKYSFGFHLIRLPGLVVLILFALAVRIAARRFLSRLLARERGKSEKEYWRIHGG
jgi:hypothetical protein